LSFKGFLRTIRRGSLAGRTTYTIEASIFAAGAAHLAHATLEAVCYQTHDLFEAMAEDGVRPIELRVNGAQGCHGSERTLRLQGGRKDGLAKPNTQSNDRVIGNRWGKKGSRNINLAGSGEMTSDALRRGYR
jgi:hypothetical protein